MLNLLKSLRLLSVVVVMAAHASAAEGSIRATELRCEYLPAPLGIDAVAPRLSWQIESQERGALQKAYRVLVASSRELLDQGVGDLWDSGKVDSKQTLFVRYEGKRLESRQRCFWNVQVWDASGHGPHVSETSKWTMGLLDADDWSADYISYRDPSPVHQDVNELFLPAARQFRKSFAATREVKRATIYSTALGIYELHLNGNRVGDAYFAPGWTDYRQRAYYNTYDVTESVAKGNNALGVWLADGWYSGYVGFGLLTGMGTEKTGRATYGKTPAVMVQLEIEYADGSRETVGTDTSWKVTDEGPIREADLLMGEAYDARREMVGWSTAGFDDRAWQAAVLAEENGNVEATFYEAKNPAENRPHVQVIGEKRNLGFKRPKLEAFPGVPVLVTEELPAKKMTKRAEGTYVFDLGQNFAGVIRLKLKGAEGHQVTIRYGEMLHPDGRLMTENLRKARATDYYTCRGDESGEVYQPRFTFHGFQYVEVANFPGEPTLDTVTGLAMHSATPMVSEFECSDPMVNQLFKNVLWTQRSNFLDLPTDCPQRDERMGWTGDAQAYVGTAAYNADIGAFYTKWLRELMESQRPSGAFPGYAPFPFQHGWDFGTAWADAGVICPWTMWQAYGDTRVIEDCWEPMTRFMQWRDETSMGDLGVAHGNAWGDWLTQGAETPLEYIDSVYYAISTRMMAEMAEAIGRDVEAKRYRDQLERTRVAFAKKYLREDGRVNVRTQTAQALALFADLVPEAKREATGRYLAELIADNGNHMATGFLGTRPLLPVLSDAGQHDLAVFLLQSREFPSWGYEIENGATTIWERWDSYTKEDAFGRHNAAMNSFSHYAFGAVCEWMFSTLAGIESDGPGYERITIRPRPPRPGSNAMHEPIDWVRASYDSIRGPIRSEWRIRDGRFELSVEIPANTTATVYLPTSDVESIRESGKSLANHTHVSVLKSDDDVVALAMGSGKYTFTAKSGLNPAMTPLQTSAPKDTSMNPDEISLEGAKKLVTWNFAEPKDVAKWNGRNNLDVTPRDGATYLVASGDDSQLFTTFAPVSGRRLAIELRASPGKGSDSQFFWAAPQAGFNGVQQSKRRLNESKEVNSYLFAIPSETTIDKLRFDPFATYDEYANKGEMRVESISVYELADDGGQ